MYCKKEINKNLSLAINIKLLLRKDQVLSMVDKVVNNGEKLKAR